MALNDHDQTASIASSNSTDMTFLSVAEIVQRSFAAIWLMASLGTLYSWSIFVRPLEVEFVQSRAFASTTFSVAIITFTIGMMIAPSINRTMRPSIIALSICVFASAGLTLAALGSSVLLTMIGFGGIFGLANGWGYSFSLRIIGGVSNRRGLFIGLAVASYTVGSAVASPILNMLIGVNGYRITLLFLAAYFLFTGVLASLILRSVNLGIGAQPTSYHEKPSIAALEFLILWSCFFLNSMIGVMALAHAAPLISSLSGSEEAVVLAVVVVSIGNGFGRLGGGWLADGLPGRLLLAGAPSLAFFALAMLTVSPFTMTALLSLAVIGAAYGSIASGMPTIIAKYYGDHHMSWMYGRIFTAWGLAGILGPIIGGATFDADGSYKRAIIGAMAIALVAAIVGAIYYPRKLKAHPLSEASR